MLFTLQPKQDKWLESVYETSMKDLEDFFEFKWSRNRPNIIVVKDKETIRNFRKKNQPEWAVGWISNGDVYILDKKNYLNRSTQKEISAERYVKLVKHELAHCFFRMQSKGVVEPDWLWEGVSLYVADQVEGETPLLKSFIGHYDHANKN